MRPLLILIPRLRACCRPTDRHLSRWFVFGSVFVTIISLVTLVNNFIILVGTDDSNLPETYYCVAWSLLVFSGIFLSVGSLAWVRGMNDPPLKPLFSWHHFSTDELLGSWMYLVSVLPAVPYTLIYFVYTNDQLWLLMFFLSLLAVLVFILFVRATYPSAHPGKGRVANLLPLVRCLFGCCCRQFIEKHFESDWLVACWIMFWGTMVGTVGFFLYTIYLTYTGTNSLTLFVNATGVVDFVWFLIGSMYFVSGSYSISVDLQPLVGHDTIVPETRNAILDSDSVNSVPYV